MGINRRNADFTLALNPRRYYPWWTTKCAPRNWPWPRIFRCRTFTGGGKGIPGGAICRYGSRTTRIFVVKPAHGSGGQGILVIAGKSSDNYRTVGGEILTQEELNHHVFNILGGLLQPGAVRRMLQ